MEKSTPAGRDQLRQPLGQLSVTPPGQVHPVHLIELAPVGVHEVGAHQPGALLVAGRQGPGLLHAAAAHRRAAVGLFHHRQNGGRADDQDVRLLLPPAVHALGLAHQALHADGDTGGVDAQPLLGVVGAQHDDEQVNDLVALQQGVGAAQGVHALVERVREHGGAAAEALLRHQEILAQGLLQQAGPALVLVEADAAVGAVGGVGAVAVGIGITQTENVLFHGAVFLSPSPAGRAAV